MTVTTYHFNSHKCMRSQAALKGATSPIFLIFSKKPELERDHQGMSKTRSEKLPFAHTQKEDHGSADHRHAKGIKPVKLKD